MVIAGGGRLPWAYMLPIQRIFAEIQMLLGGIKVKLPKADEIVNIQAGIPLTPQPLTPISTLQEIEEFGADDAGPSFKLHIPGRRNVVDPDSSASQYPVHVRNESVVNRYSKTAGSRRIPSSEKTYEMVLVHELVPVHLRSVTKHLSRKDYQSFPRPLHEQRMLGRNIVITEDPNMHLVVHQSRIFMKPLPLYLTRRLWRPEALIPESEAFALLLTYVETVQYPSDLQIAKEAGLLTEGIDWKNWKTFSRQVLGYEEGPPVPALAEGMNRFMEVKLDTLCRLEQDKSPRLLDPQAGGYYGSLRQLMDGDGNAQLSQRPPMTRIGLFVLAFGIFVLLAFLTGLNGDVLSKNAGFQQASYGFVAFCLTTSATITTYLILAILAALLPVIRESTGHRPGFTPWRTAGHLKGPRGEATVAEV
jgi:hypothetical protein